MDAVQSFLNGENFPKPEPVSTSPPDGVTEEHREIFRELADTFGRRKMATVLNPTHRMDSDQMLDGLIRSELGAYPPDIVERAIDAALRDANAVRLRDIQDGSAGKGRGGMPSLLRHLEKVMRSKADDLMRAHRVSAAKDRTEKIVREGDLEKRIRGVRSTGGGKKRGSSWDDIADDLGLGTTYAEAQGA
jgi:hypothetical protein